MIINDVFIAYTNSEGELIPELFKNVSNYEETPIQISFLDSKGEWHIYDREIIDKLLVRRRKR